MTPDEDDLPVVRDSARGLGVRVPGDIGSDEAGKVDLMRLIAKEHGIKDEHCVFIGDGKNDVHLAQAVGFSIAFNAQVELKRVSTIVIDQPKGQENFYATAEAIRNYFQEDWDEITNDAR